MDDTVSSINEGDTRCGLVAGQPPNERGPCRIRPPSHLTMQGVLSLARLASSLTLLVLVLLRTVDVGCLLINLVPVYQMMEIKVCSLPIWGPGERWG